MIDIMGQIVGQLATVTAFTWALTEVIGRLTGKSKLIISILLGPTLATLAWRLGLVPLIDQIAKPGQNWALAALSGLAAIVLAKVFHDLVANPLMKKLQG